MIDVKEFIVPSQMSLVEAMGVIDKGARGVAFVCDENGKVLGSISDGDVRRFIMKGGSLSAPAQQIAHRSFYFLTPAQVDQAQDQMEKYDVRALPVLDENGRILSICFKDKTVAQPIRPLDLPVVVMAGGKGTRLYPYTQVLPKPLIPIGDYTITEHIMRHFQVYGCQEFHMIVNYKKNLIKAYFSDSALERNISFYDEENPLGTGGGLKLLEGCLHHTFFMTNCDILVEADYGAIWDYHKQSRNLATMVCAMKKVTIPYGTVEVTEQGQISSMREKPTYSFLTNTGFYLLEPEIFRYIPENTFIHITDILESCMADGQRVGIYPIGESQWSDMGQIPEMEKMRKKIVSE